MGGCIRDLLKGLHLRDLWGFVEKAIEGLCLEVHGYKWSNYKCNPYYYP